MQEVLTDFLTKRKNRAIAIILSAKEQDLDCFISEEASRRFRKIIIDQLNELNDACIDVMASLDTGEVVLNQNYLDKLDELHEAVVKNGARHG